MRKRKETCIACGRAITAKNDIGINLKLLGEDTRAFYCIDCLAEYLEVSVEDLLEKISDYRDQGCRLFD